MPRKVKRPRHPDLQLVLVVAVLQEVQTQEMRWAGNRNQENKMKLSALPIILIGLALGVVVLSYAFFWEYKPNMDQAAFNTEQARALETEANKMPLAKKRVALA